MRKRKIFIKRMSTLLCALVIVGMCFGVASPYYASTYSDFDIADYIIDTDKSSSFRKADDSVTLPPPDGCGRYFMTVRRGDIVLLYSSDIPIVLDFYDNSSDSIKLYRYLRYQPDDTFRAYQLNGGQWVSIGFDVLEDMSAFYKADIGCVFAEVFSVDGTLKNAMYNYTLVEYVNSNHTVSLLGEYDFFVPNGTYPIIEPVIEVYNPALGFLNNVNIKTTWLTDKDGNVDYDSFRETISYDLITTSEVDLSVGDYSIRVFGQLSYCKTLKQEIYDDNFPLIYFGDFDASLGKFTYNSNELYDLITEKTDDPYSGWDILVKQIARSDNLYLQIYDNSTGECGGYLKISFYSEGGYKQSTLDTDLNEYVGGFVDKDVDTSVGSGTNYDDAELNSKPANPDAFEDMESAFNSFTSTIGVIPQVVASLFSFLPPWCLNLCAVGFGLMIAVIIYKLLRG